MNSGKVDKYRMVDDCSPTSERCYCNPADCDDKDVKKIDDLNDPKKRNTFIENVMSGMNSKDFELLTILKKGPEKKSSSETSLQESDASNTVKKPRLR